MFFPYSVSGECQSQSWLQNLVGGETDARERVSWNCHGCHGNEPGFLWFTLCYRGGSVSFWLSCWTDEARDNDRKLV